MSNRMMNLVFRQSFQASNNCKLLFDKWGLRHRTFQRLFCKSSEDGNDERNKAPKLPPSKAGRFTPFSDEDSRPVLDVDEEMYRNYSSTKEKYLYQEKKPNRIEDMFGDLNLLRGEDGVFDIQDLVESLTYEKLKDIAVIEIPAEYQYCDHMVIATALSWKHLENICEFLNKLYKVKKHKSDPFLSISPTRKEDWKVIDLNNIVLHLFLANARETYDIESLWTVGREYDAFTQKVTVDTTMDLVAKHMKFLEELKPIDEEQQIPGRPNQREMINDS